VNTAPVSKPPVSREFIIWGTLVMAGFLMLHALGWRQYTTVVTATLPSGAVSMQEVSTRAFLYFVLYFGTLIVTPMFYLAALLEWGWRRLRRHRPVTSQ